MGQVMASAWMPLEGSIAKDDNTIGRPFDWSQNGRWEIPTVDDDTSLHLSPPGEGDRLICVPNPAPEQASRG